MTKLRPYLSCARRPVRDQGAAAALAELRPRLDLMHHATPGYSFGASLECRADGLELMDGYTRYTALRRFCQRDVFVYRGRSDD